MSRLTAKGAAKHTTSEARHAKDFAKEYVVPHLATARDAVVPALEHAREAVAPVLGQAREAAAPHLTVARDKAMSLKDEVLPKVAAGVSAGLAASEPVRTEAIRRGTASIAALRGQIEPPKTHRGRRRAGKFLVVVALGAGASAAYKAWKLPHASDDWVHTDATTDGAIPATTNPADALAEELRARNGQVPDPVAH
jgi:hypothetical protein